MRTTTLCLSTLFVFIATVASAHQINKRESQAARDSARCAEAHHVYHYDVAQILQRYNDPCVDQGTAAIAFLNTRILFVCKNSRLHAAYPLSYGDRGFPKQRQGDRKTPIGDYALTYGGVDHKLGPYVRTNYPNADDVLAGRTGSGILIHGPLYGLSSNGNYYDERCEGEKNVKRDWTEGCISLASDATATAFADFVRANSPINIRIVE